MPQLILQSQDMWEQFLKQIMQMMVKEENKIA